MGRVKPTFKACKRPDPFTGLNFLYEFFEPMNNKNIIKNVVYYPDDLDITGDLTISESEKCMDK